MVSILNILIPGAGLIVRHREWLGFSLALIFGICGNIAIAGWLIAPEAIPGWLEATAVVLTCFAWMLAQLLFWRQGAWLRARQTSAVEVLSPADPLARPEPLQRGEGPAALPSHRDSAVASVP